MPIEPFEPQPWVDVPDPENPPPGALEVEAATLIQGEVGPAEWAKAYVDDVMGSVASAADLTLGQVPVAGAGGQFAYRDPLTIDVRKYGLINDVTANQAATTTRIQAALDEAAAIAAQSDAAQPGGYSVSVELPCGWFKVTGLTIGNNVRLKGQGDATTLILASGANANLIEGDEFGTTDGVNRGIWITDLRLYGNKANQSASLAAHGQVTADTTIDGTGGAGVTLPVSDTSNMPASGYAWAGDTLIQYTSKTSNSLGGVKRASGNFTSMRRRGCWVTPLHSKGHLIALQAKRCHIRVYGNDAAASGIFFQGVDSGLSGEITPESVIHPGTRIDTCNRFGLEIGEGASDGWIMGTELGSSNRKGALLVRGANWKASSIHLVGTFGSMEVTGPALTIAANSFRATTVYMDTWPYTPIVIDTTIRDTSRISGTDIQQAEHFQCGWGSGRGAVGVLCRGRAGVSTIARTRISGHEMWAPYTHGVSSLPWTSLVGQQNLASLADNKLQVSSCADFSETSDIGGPLAAGADSLTYTGRQMSQTKLSQDATSGDTTLHVGSTAGFDSSGKIRVLAFDGGTFNAMVLSYTAKTATTFTIPASGPGSIASPLSGSAAATISSAGQRGGVSQHFFTGVAGGTLTRNDDSSIAATAQAPTISEWRESDNVYRSFLVGRHNFYNGADDWTQVNGSSGGKKMKASGTITITNGNTTGTAAHGLAEAPDSFVAVAASNTANAPSSPHWVTVSSSNITVNLQSAATGTMTYQWRAEITT